MNIVMDFWAYFTGEFLHGLLAMPIWIYVAVIALFFGLITVRFLGALIIPVLAAAIFIAALILGPVIISGKELTETLPDFQSMAFAQKAVASYLLFLVLDTVVFVVKKLILKIVD